MPENTPPLIRCQKKGQYWPLFILLRFLSLILPFPNSLSSFLVKRRERGGAEDAVTFRGKGGDEGG
jgi:hypothetical protein